MSTTVLAPAASVSLSAPAPYVVQSCVVSLPPPPAPAEGVITLPAPPTVEYENLPVIDPDQYIDTSPDRILGCANSLPEGGEQAVLRGLFPDAIGGDGIINRGTGDIWKYDGTDWENVGPNPGLILQDPVVLPPWNETEIYDATVRTRLQVVALDYALALLTEPDPIGVVLGLAVGSARSVKVPAASYEIAPAVPEVTISADPTIYGVFPVTYTGDGTSGKTITGLPWSPGMVWSRARFVSGYAIIIGDTNRGLTKYWLMAPTPGAELTLSTVYTSFDANGYTLGNSAFVNQNGLDYIGWAFPPLSANTTSTVGVISATVASADFIGVSRYSGSGTAGHTVAHGLTAAPEFIIIKELTTTGFGRDPIAGGSVIGNNSVMTVNSTAARTTSTGFVRSADAQVITLGSDVAVNNIVGSHVAYSFRSVPGLCKIGTYTGDGDTNGIEVYCGFAVRFLLVKRMTGGVGGWNLIDSARNQGTEQLLTDSVAEATVSTFYELTSTGFVAKRGDLSTDHDLNISGSEYMYMAIGSSVPDVVVPAFDLSLTALAPSV
jgi:hypothetical protein